MRRRGEEEILVPARGWRKQRQAGNRQGLRGLKLLKKAGIFVGSSPRESGDWTWQSARSVGKRALSGIKSVTPIG